MNNTEYDEKIKREREWYTHGKFNRKHILNSRLFYSQERNNFNYIFPRCQFAKQIHIGIQSNKNDNPSILIAPIGSGGDLPYIIPLSSRICGIDISPEAIDTIKKLGIEAYVGDINKMSMFQDDQFDIVLMPLFFHHVRQFGFEQFLKECFRVLKPGGFIFSLEPSSWHPMAWVSWVLRKIVGNITGLVEDEAPFPPRVLSQAMKQTGFRNVEVLGASFCHNRIPIPLAKVTNFLTYPLLKIPIVNNLAWMCIFSGRKPLI
jgi:SAM-dependent methyltransferase